VDTSRPDYLLNWYEEMNLVCTSKSLISFLAASYYIGYGLGCIFFAVPDRYGRRKPLLLGLFLFGLGYSIVLFVNDINWKILGFLVMGIMHLKFSICFVALFELLSEKNKSIGSTIINVFDSGTVGFACLSYILFSNNYWNLQIVMFITGIGAFFLTFLVPESPKWLITKNRYADAVQVFNYMAAFNLSPNRIHPKAVIYE